MNIFAPNFNKIGVIGHSIQCKINYFWVMALKTCAIWLSFGISHEGIVRYKISDNVAAICPVPCEEDSHGDAPLAPVPLPLMHHQPLWHLQYQGWTGYPAFWEKRFSTGYWIQCPVRSFTVPTIRLNLEYYVLLFISFSLLMHFCI